ncbi:MAG: DUF362 domain-containing protein [Thermoguttaceae bacterium]
MSHCMNRRKWLACGLGAAGLLAGGKFAAAIGEEALVARKLPDRSRDAPTSPVSIQRCGSYEPHLLRRRLDESLNLIGGIKKLVEGKTVTIKMNLTGGPGELGGLPAYRTYHVHPNVVTALCAAVHGAGAKRIVLVEGQYSVKKPEEVLQSAGWDVKGIQSAGGQKVIFEDTRNRGSWSQYSRLKVPWGGFIFPAFDVNGWYEKTDVFISLSKLKEHANAGLTMACKNLFGIAPTALYGGDSPNENTIDYRGETLHFGNRKVPAGVTPELDHGVAKGDFLRRVPRVTADIVGSRPIDLSVIDGIETNRGGEGPWIKGVQPLQPKLLLAGRNPVCVDAVCAAVMGYDAQAGHFQFPFMGDNHLKLLASMGIGTNDVKRIEVRGLSIREALFPFNPRKLPIPLTFNYQHHFACAVG